MVRERIDLSAIVAGDEIIRAIRVKGLKPLAHAGNYLHLCAAIQQAGEMGYWLQAIEFLDAARKIAEVELHNEVAVLSPVNPAGPAATVPQDDA